MSQQGIFEFPQHFRELSHLRTASKTVLKFTSRFRSEALPKSVSVNLDKFHFQADCSLPEPDPDQVIYWLNGDIALEYQKSGTPMFKHSYVMIRHGEPVANVITHSRDPKKVPENRIKIELLNHVLYSSEWLQVMDEVCDALKAIPVVFSNIDIALDGCNHVPLFLNYYCKQTPEKKIVELKGKAHFSPGIMDKKTMMFNHFKIGSSHKKIRIYNKTQEIERESHKEYIRHSWEKAGMDLNQDNWRTELRLDSQAIKSIAGFDYRRLMDPNYMLSIFRTLIKNFFEFAIVDHTDTNISRWKVVDLFQFEQLRVTVLDKLPKAVVRGAYKAKMAIHNAVANICRRYINAEADVMATIHHIKLNIDLYDLGRYYLKRLPQWINQYRTYTPFEPENLLLELV